MYIYLCLLFFSPPFLIFAEWIDPKEIVSGTWGKNTGQFYYESQDTFDAFPKNIGDDKNNNIIISDEGNRRVYVFMQNGKIKKIIQKPLELLDVDFAFGRWPGEVILLPYNNLFIFSCDYKQVKKGYQPLRQCIVDYEGKITAKIELAEIFMAAEGFFLFKNEKYYHYSPTGQLLKTYDTRPLELGMVNEQNLGSGKYKTTIQYPDKTYVTDRLTYHNYIRGCDDTLYATLYKEIVRYDADSKLTAELVVPDTEYKIIRPAGGGFNEVKELIVDYGDPVLAPNGDVYTWKRTPDKYSIIKWVWVDGPECPQYLDVTPTKNSLKFTWQKPTKDADKVTGYQLLQSYNICGPFRQTALLKKDQLSFEDRDVKKGETYYYIVKAVRGKDYSGNSNKVCGQLE